MNKKLITTIVCGCVILCYIFGSDIKFRDDVAQAESTNIESQSMNRAHKTKNNNIKNKVDKTSEDISASENDEPIKNKDDSDKSVDNNQEGRYKDGIYTGSANGFKAPVEVKVEVKSGNIDSIKIISSGDDEPYFTNARAVIEKIIDSQSPDVDVVGGATFSSNGIIDAVKSALK